MNTFDITINGAKHEVFMSYGLLSEITSIVGDPARCSIATIDAELRQKLTEALLAKRKKSGKVEEAFDQYDDMEVDVEKLEDLINWACGHVLSFFIRNMQKADSLLKKHGEAVKHLQSSMIGSAPSPSPTP